MREENITTGLHKGCDWTPTRTKQLVQTEHSAGSGEAEEKVRQKAADAKAYSVGD